MSKTIDERVVSMQFDNRQFEQNVSTTMSTLDKLKQKLNLDGAAKGFENIDSAAKKVNLSGLCSAADNVAVKFSHMQMTVQHQIDRLVDSAVNAGTRLAKSLSVDQITAGMSKYEQKTASIQTLVNSTGKSVEEINGYLEKLMWFSDETSYGFTDMTSGLATMVSSGGDIEKLIPMIMGVANATAFAGKGAAEFSRVLQYGVNQAYSLGYMQVMDWKTLENATVNSKQLMESLIAAGEALGTIKEGTVDASNFRSTLQDKWLTKEVMEAGFGRFSELTEAAYELLNGNIGDFPEEVQKLFNAGEIETAADAISVLSEYYDDIAVRAFKSAQEAKSFTEAIEATKDAVSSGWMTTFELIFGDYEDAKNLWTNLANALWSVFASGAEVRNWIVGTAMNFAKPWDAITEKLGNITKVTSKLKDAAIDVEYFQKVVSDVWRGDYDNGDKRKTLLKNAGYDARVVQTLVNKGSQYKITVEDIEKAHEKFGLTLETTVEETEELAVALNDLNEEQLINAGLTEDEVDLYEALSKEAKRTGTTVEKLAKEMSEVDGRTLLIEGVNNIGNAILDVAQIAKTAFADIFNPPGAAELAIKIYNAIKAFKEFTDGLGLVDRETGELTETGEKISRVFKGMFAAIQMVITILKGPVQFVFTTINKILQKFGTSALDILADVGDTFVAMNEKVTEVIDAITTFIAENVSTWIDEFKETEFFKTVAGWFESASDRISSAIGNITEKISNFEANSFVQTLSKIGGFFKGLVSSFANSDIGSAFIGGVTGFFENIRSFFANIPELSISDFDTFFGKLASADFSSIGSAFGAIGEGLKTTVFTKFKAFFKNVTSISWDDFKITAFSKFIEFWDKTGDWVKKAFESFAEFGESVKLFVFGTEEITLRDILDVAEKVLGIIVAIKALNLLNGLVEPFDNITDAINNFASSMKWKAIASTFKSMALALAVFTICIIALTQMDDMNKAERAAKMLANLIIAMGLVAVGLGFAASKLGGEWSTMSVAVSLLAMVAALALLIWVIKEIDGMTLKDPNKTFGVLTGAVLALVIGMGVINKAVGSSFKSIAAVLTLITALNMLLGVITAYDEYDWTGKSAAIERMVKMLFVLSGALAISSLGGGGGSMGLAFTLLAMVFSLKLLLSAIEEFSQVDDSTLEKGGRAVAKLLGMMTIIGAALSLVSKGNVLEKGQRRVNAFAGLAVALLVVVAAIWLLGRMANKNPEMYMKGLNGVIAILGVFALLFTAIGWAVKGSDKRTVQTLFGVIIGLAGLVVLIGWLLQQMSSKLSVEDTTGHAKALATVLLSMVACMAIISKLKVSKWSNVLKLGFMLGGLVIVLAGLGLVLAEMSALNVTNGIANAFALGLLLTAMSGVLHILSGLDMRKLSNSKMLKLGLALAGMAVIMAMLGLVLAEMSALNVTNAIGNAFALGILINAMASAIMILGMSKGMTRKQMESAVGAMAVMSLLMIVLAVVLGIMDSINPLRAIGNAIALGVLINAMSAAMLILSFASPLSNTALAGMYLMSGVVTILAVVLGALSKFNCDLAIGNALSIGILLNAMAAAMWILGFALPPSAGVLAGMYAMSGVVLILAVILGALSVFDCTVAISTAISLSTLLLAMSVVYVILGLTGGMAASALAGAWGLVNVIGLLGTVAIAIGGLMSLFPAASIEKWKEGFTNFMDFLGILAEGLGKMVSGFVVGFTDGIAEAGENLKEFANSLGEIDPEAVNGVESLCAAINALTGANLKDALTQLLPGDNSLSTFGENIAAFAVCIKDAAIVLNDITDEDVANITRSAKAGEALATLNDVIPGSGGVWQALAGEKDLADWGVKISAFADSLVAYSAKVSGKVIDADAIKKSADAAGYMTTLNEAIPRTGGVWQEIAGNVDLDQWGLKIVAFAESLINYSNTISEADIDTDAILRSADAANALAEVNQAIPTNGGLWEAIAGGKDLTIFGSGLISLAEGLVTYADSAVEITDAKIEGIKKSGLAIDELKMVTEKLPSSGGVWGKLWGDKDPLSFGAGITSMSEGIVSAVNVANTLPDDIGERISKLGDAVTNINSVLELVPCSPHTKCITDFKDAVANIKTGITEAMDIVSEIDDEGIYDKSVVLVNVADQIKLCSDTIAAMNTITYGGIDTLKAAIKSLSEISIDGIIEAFSGKSEAMTAAVNSIVNALSTGLSEGSDKVSEEAGKLIGDIIKAVEDKKDNFKTLAQDIVSNLILGFHEEQRTLVAGGEALGNNVSRGAYSTRNLMQAAGGNLGDGLILGINDKQDAVYWAGYRLGQKAVQGEKDGQQSNSPSKATIKAGNWMGEGLVIGMEQMGNSVYNAGKEMGSNAVGSISNSIRAISDAIDMDMDTQPTIRPVIDLSDVKTGTAAISGMFDGVYGVGVQTNLGAINMAMNARSQNGTNDDIISAINKLNNGIANSRGDTYQVNGVTYDDGSNIADAVRTIARAAVRERRV